MCGPLSGLSFRLFHMPMRKKEKEKKKARAPAVGKSLLLIPRHVYKYSSTEEYC